MYWNNRIMKEFYKPEGWVYAIHEVYYDKWDNPYMWTVEPTECTGSDIQDLRYGYDLKAKAFDAPVLDYETGVDETYYYMWE